MVNSYAGNMNQFPRFLCFRSVRLKISYPFIMMKKSKANNLLPSNMSLLYSVIVEFFAVYSICSCFYVNIKIFVWIPHISCLSFHWFIGTFCLFPFFFAHPPPSMESSPPPHLLSLLLFSLFLAFFLFYPLPSCCGNDGNFVNRYKFGCHREI